MVADQAAAAWRCPGFYLSLRSFSLFEFIHNPCSTAVRCPIDYIRGAVVQRLVCSFRVVKHKVFRQPELRFRHGGIASQIYVFVLDAPPEPFHEYIVQCTAAAVHADADAVRLEHAGEGLRGKLTALIGVEDLGDAICL